MGTHLPDPLQLHFVMLMVKQTSLARRVLSRVKDGSVAECVAIDASFTKIIFLTKASSYELCNFEFIPSDLIRCYNPCVKVLNV